MTVSANSKWLFLVFSLPAKRATQRVEVWRKLRRIGALPLGSAGYLLPKTAANHEHFEWLAASIRKYKGQASVIQVESIDDLPSDDLARRFIEARSRDYESLAGDITKTLRRKNNGAQMARLRRRFQEINDIDFFRSPMRGRVETLLARASEPQPEAVRSVRKKREYSGRTWLTRPRPGIDRVSSAWLITKFIDPQATFAFADDTKKIPQAVPFDMFQAGGFGHRGDGCTFETLRARARDVVDAANDRAFRGAREPLPHDLVPLRSIPAKRRFQGAVLCLSLRTR